MESFFDREVKRLDFVGERNQLRENQKKAMDDQKIAEQEVSSSSLCWPAVTAMQ